MEVVTKIAPIALALIMLGLGMGLTLRDFLRVINNPKDFIVGLICQLILLPIIAYALIIILGTPVELALGVMIIAAAPGGVTTNVLTKFAKGDVALSISLTAVISLISIISVPFIIFQSAKLLGISNISEEITMTGIAIKMAGVVTVPVILGMIIRKFAERFISSNISIIEKITAFLFLIVFSAIWIEERENIFSYLAQAGLVTLLLNVVMMIIAYYIAKSFATGIEQRRCIAIECGLQNGTLAVFVATQIFSDIVYIVPTAAYALIMYITAFIFMYIVRNSR
ncbi:bile acid:sodium symporter family protein [Candidatus Pelagibacter sp.]|nr:bile acid:sodium symporter family protein [Candidatus Pelagibacter sp.]